MANETTRRGGTDVPKRGGDSGIRGDGGEGAGDGMLHDVNTVASHSETSESASVLQNDLHGTDAGKEVVRRSVLLPEDRERTGHTDQHLDGSNLRASQDSGPEPRGTDDDKHEESVQRSSSLSGQAHPEIRIPLPSGHIEINTVTFKFLNDTTTRARIVAGNIYSREFLEENLPFSETQTNFDTYLASSNLFKILSFSREQYERH